MSSLEKRKSTWKIFAILCLTALKYTKLDLISFALSLEKHFSWKIFSIDFGKQNTHREFF